MVFEKNFHYSTKLSAQTGPASFLEQATIFYAPSTSNGSALMRLVAQAAACPADATRKSSTSASFYRRAHLQNQSLRTAQLAPSLIVSDLATAIRAHPKNG
jgi:hypothetical protein